MLRYNEPAADWNSALPLGNGRLGAMVYGGVHAEVLRLNEESVWYGGVQDRTPVGAKEHVENLRELIRAGKHGQAESLVKKHFLATPRSARHYEPLGTCGIRFDYSTGAPSHGASEVLAEGYERSLNLSRAESVVRYSVNGNAVRREAVATHEDNVIAIRIAAERPITFTLSLTRMSDVDWETNEFLDSIAIVDRRIVLRATPGGKGSNELCLVAAVRLDSAGSIKVVGRELEVTATDALVFLAARTQYRYVDIQEAAMADIDAIFKRTTTSIWERHLGDWAELYNRMTLELYPDDKKGATIERLRNGRDPGLAALYFSYARYLLLSCSHSYPHALPATLQGIWNPSFQPPWGSKYTININLQMNYWAVHASNLSECEMPLFDLLERMAANGKRTASEVWGCRGWCAHHGTDIFGDTETQDSWMPATLWPLGGAWLCTHIWEYYSFTSDDDFLARMAPVLEGCVQFLIDLLTLDSEGRYFVTNPSLSPENTFRHEKSGERGVFCEGSTMDMEIVRQVMTHYLSTTSTLGKQHSSKDVMEGAERSLSRLPPITISPRTKTIQEWGRNDFEETELGHRHVSHLYGLHPSNTITPSSTPALAEAAVKTLNRRIEHGGGHTGWSRAWLINLWARLREADKCALNIEALLRDSTLPNLLDTHPPFQIDGNFGGAAGIMECLVQSHEEIKVGEASTQTRLIRLLPACPLEWKSGVIRGAKCRGGFEMDFKWENGKIQEPVVVISERGNKALVVFHDEGVDGEKIGITIPARSGRCLLFRHRITYA